MARATAALAAFLLLAGCASHRIYVPDFDPAGIAGEPVTVDSLSVAGRKGATSGHNDAVAKYCGKADLASVEVRKNVWQGLVSTLTLGLVSPAKILFYCAKEPIEGQ